MIDAVLFNVQLDKAGNPYEPTFYTSFSPTFINSVQHFSNTEGFLANKQNLGPARVTLLTAAGLAASSNGNYAPGAGILLFQPLMAIPFNSSTPVAASTLLAQNTYETNKFLLYFFNQGTVVTSSNATIPVNGNMFFSVDVENFPAVISNFTSVTGQGYLIPVHVILMRCTTSLDPFFFSVTRYTQFLNEKILLNKPLHIALTLVQGGEAIFSIKFFFHMEYSFN